MSSLGGIEVFFDFTPDTDLSIDLVTDIVATPVFAPASIVGDNITINIGSGATVDHIIVKTLIGADIVDQSDYFLGDSPSEYAASGYDYRIRVFLYKQYISIYCNEKWVYTYILEDIDYPDTPSLSLFARGGQIEVRNTNRVELFECREAVFVDYEATADNAIQSIIQQRPVEIYSEPGRAYAFTYNGIRDEVAGIKVTRISRTISDPSDMSSDGLVYFSDVGVSLSVETLKDVGFITRMYRLSELDFGAERAAGVYQKKALESRERLDIEQRFDPRVEIGDVLSVSQVLSGTETVYEKSVIVENVDMAIREGDSDMTNSGRIQL